jgi:S1-C subfamily serine protease
MNTPEAAPRNGRETRLLLVTIAVSVGVLLLLARFRFPEAPAVQPVESAPAPLERLAAQAAYDELASIMADLERRLTPRITIVRTQMAGGGISATVAPRLLPDRAVAVVDADTTIIGAVAGGDHEIIARDRARNLAVLRVPAVDGSAVTARSGPPRFGPRYVAVIEATPIGPAVRPVYVGRVETFQDPQTGVTLLSLAAAERALPRGTAVFTLDGLFIGLVRDGGDTAVVLPGEALTTVAQSAQPSSASRAGDLGISIDALTASLSRATGAETGVMVVLVTPGGPADGVLQSGDVIQSIDGVPITNVEQFRDVEFSRAPGTEVAIAGVRRRAPMTATVKAADSAAPGEKGNPVAPDEAGLVGRTVAGVGTEVVTVVPGSAAALAGLQRDDLILAADAQKAPTSADLLRRFRSAEQGAAILLTVQRGSHHRVLALERR